jgi:hypothetical protein
MDVDPGIDVRSAKVYFRSDTYPKFYYIEMKPSGAGLRSVLPRPSAETERIVYYIETVDVTFASIVGAEQVLEVRTDCVEEEKGEEVASLPPEITVGSVEAGSPAIPPGFEAAGIIGTIASTGVLPRWRGFVWNGDRGRRPRGRGHGRSGGRGVGGRTGSSA